MLERGIERRLSQAASLELGRNLPGSIRFGPNNADLSVGYTLPVPEWRVQCTPAPSIHGVSKRVVVVKVKFRIA